MKKQVMLHIDGSIPIVDISRALATIGCTLSSDANGELRVAKRRGRTPSRPVAASTEHSRGARETDATPKADGPESSPSQDGAPAVL